MSLPRVVHVVVPAHDEAERLPACLAALDVATAAVADDVAVHCTVVLDRCTDDSAAIVSHHRARRSRADPRVGWHVHEVAAGGVGAARVAGVAHARALTADHDGARVWVASTDADSRVPAGWLREQVELAARGHDLVLGRVDLDHDPVPGLRARWDRLHTDPVGHVFGANLGVRLSAHDLVGGFAPVAEHEDVALVAALRRRGVPVARAHEVVRTSARLQGRTPGGLAGYLGALAAGCSGRTPLVVAPVED